MKPNSPSPDNSHHAGALARLDIGMNRRLTLLIAPAGFGKTALLRQWLTTHKRPTAWLTLEPVDNAPELFLADLVVALQAALPQIQLSVGDTSLQDGIIDLINALTSVPGDLSLILDNYHVISEPLIHQAMRLLLDYLPPQVHLIIASRTEPPLQLPRLRVRRQLVELGPADLR